MRRIKGVMMALCVFASAYFTTSCKDAIEVQYVYDYEMETMPVPKQLMDGQTAELRCQIIKSGSYDQMELTMRYFQTDGKGELRLDDGTLFLPNDRYALDREEFRLYYTSRCSEQQSIDIYIEDNFGQVEKYTFSWTSESESDGDE